MGTSKSSLKHEVTNVILTAHQIPIQSHFHPSVSVFAAALVDKAQKVQKPDLESHSLIKFLDKFVYRSPKVSDAARGTSIMQPLRAAKDVGDIWLGTRASGTQGTSVNSATFWTKKQEEIAAEDVFFHEYFQQAGQENKKQSKPSRTKDGEADEDDDDAGEDEIWKALVSSKPEVDGDDGGSDGFEDLDEDDMASDDDSLPFDLDDMSDDEEGGSGLEEEEDEGVEYHSDEEEGSDGLVAVDAEDSDEAAGPEKKKKDERRERRKKLKALPTFASVDDYAELLGQEEDERYD
jgi:ribosome biogenesis protein MAK21